MLRAVGRLRALIRGIFPQPGQTLLNELGDVITDESGNELTA